MRDTSSSQRNVRVPVTEDRLRHIVTHMRERDWVEIKALQWTEDPDEIIDALLPRCGRMCFVWERDGVPVAIQGAYPLWPKVWTVFAFGTDEWPRLVLDMTRHGERFMKPAVRRAGVRRVECRALASHTDSRKWIERLGFHLEAVLPHYGRNDETFVSYAWFPGEDP